jgi:choline dehydrogenase-like flavoprotein
MTELTFGSRSPQLLMVSGVGPAATLKGLGIDVVSDLPGVGQNMMVMHCTTPFQTDLASNVLVNTGSCYNVPFVPGQRLDP